MFGRLFKFFLSSAFLVGPLCADQVSSTKFVGLNNNTNSVIIDPSEAQDLLNVDVSVGGGSVKKRSGYGLYKALGTGQAIHGGHHFFDSSGNDVQVWGSSTSLYGIVAGGTPIQLVSSGTLNATWDCADSQGSAYCVNSSRNVYLKTDGTTQTWYTSPLGTMVETTPDRVIVAGVSGNQNTLYVSESSNFTNFVAGVNTTSAFTEVIASQGSRLTHIRWACGKLLWWKDQSFGTFDFEDQFNAQVNIVSDSIGTFDNTSAIDPGGQVWFRGQDGHTWKYDCSSLSKESIDITPNVQASGNRITNSWTQTTGADFASGSLVNLDTTTVSGQASLAGFNDTFSSLSNWTAVRGSWTVYSFGGNQFARVDTAVGPGTVRASIRGQAMNGFSNVTEWYATAQVAISLGAGEKFGCIGMVNVSSAGYHLCLSYSPGVANLWLNNEELSAGYGFVSLGAIIGDVHSLTLKYNNITGVMTGYWDGVQQLTATDTGFDYTGLVYPSIWGTGNSTKFIGFDDFAIRASTGSVYSAVHNAPNLTSWGTLESDYSLGGGSQTFSLRSSTNSFTALSSTPAWTSQSPGDLISISTGTYFQLKDEFAVTSGSQTPALNSFTFNWFEGAAVDQAYMLYFQDSIWQSVAFGDGQATNNYIFRKDLINDGWTLYNFGTGGMLVDSNRLYFGDTSAGNVFNYGTSTSDNGTAINAFWRSKSFTGADPFLQNSLTNIDVFAKKDQGSTLTSTYTLDTSTSTSYSVALSTPSSIIQSRKLLPSGKLGYAFDLKLGDTSASSNWEVLGFRMGYKQEPYRPSTP